MAATLQAFKSALQTTWEALTPPSDGSGLGYAFVDDLNEERGNGQHRQVLWRMASRLEPLLEVALETRWTVVCEVFFQRAPLNVVRTYAAAATAVEEEVQGLVAAQLQMNNLGTGVTEAVLVDVSIPEETPERERAGMGAGLPQDVVWRARFTFQVTTQEA